MSYSVIEMLFDTAEPFLCIIAAFLSIKIMMGKICTINFPIYDQNLHHKLPKICDINFPSEILIQKRCSRLLSRTSFFVYYMMSKFKSLAIATCLKPNKYGLFTSSSMLLSSSIAFAISGLTSSACTQLKLRN